MQTRATILAAAEVVYAQHGYTGANIAEVVERSKCTVGSIYHHFGGKAELFLALWESHERAFTEAASQAVALARASGEDDPLELFVVGARAYLEMAWTRRDRTRLFLGDDTPPGFDAVRRERGSGWVRQNSQLLQVSDHLVDRFLVGVLTSIVGQGAREICGLDSRRQAKLIIDATLDFVRRVAA